jgi:hypothetical protein
VNSPAASIPALLISVRRKRFYGINNQQIARPDSARLLNFYLFIETHSLCARGTAIAH